MKAERLCTSFNFGVRSECVVNATSQPLYPRKGDAVPIVDEAGWAPGAGINGCGKSCPHWVSIPETFSP